MTIWVSYSTICTFISFLELHILFLAHLVKINNHNYDIIYVVGAYIMDGCYKRNSANFMINPGNFDPSQITVKTCIESCVDMGTVFRFAGLMAGQSNAFCFCDTSTPDISVKVMDTDCGVLCPGDAADKCGGLKYVAVYTTSTLMSIQQLDVQEAQQQHIVKVNTHTTYC